MAVGTYALISLQRVKDWLNITNSAQDTTLERLIDAATARIETWCGRQFPARDRVEFHDGASRTLKLRHYPVNTCTYLGYGRESAIVIASTVTTDVAATVSVSSADQPVSTRAVVLTRTDSAGTVTTVTELLATYPTISALAAQINAETGWSASAVVDGPSKFLHRMGPVDARQASVTPTQPSQRSSAFRIDLNTGVIVMPGGYRDSEWNDEFDDVDDHFQTVIVNYNAGYATVPDDVAQACTEIVAAAYRARFKDANVNSESIGDYSYTSAVREAQGDLLDSLLASWREIR